MRRKSLIDIVKAASVKDAHPLSWGVYSTISVKMNALRSSKKEPDG
jgi:hypothetical protein